MSIVSNIKGNINRALILQLPKLRQSKAGNTIVNTLKSGALKNTQTVYHRKAFYHNLSAETSKFDFSGNHKWLNKLYNKLSPKENKNSVTTINLDNHVIIKRLVELKKKSGRMKVSHFLFQDDIHGPNLISRKTRTVLFKPRMGNEPPKLLGKPVTEANDVNRFMGFEFFEKFKNEYRTIGEHQAMLLKGKTISPEFNKKVEAAAETITTAIDDKFPFKKFSQETLEGLEKVKIEYLKATEKLVK